MYVPLKRGLVVPPEYLKSIFYVPDLFFPLLSPALVPDDSSARMLAQGSFSVVKLVDFGRKSYAVKQSRDQSQFSKSDEGIQSSFSREVSIVQSLDHPHIAKVRHITSDLNCIFLDLGASDLLTWVRTNGPAGHSTQVDLAVQLLSALVYLRDMGCLHRDIKPQNIIVSWWMVG